MDDEAPTIDHHPTDRLTRIADAMSETFDQHPEHAEGDKCVVFLNGGGRGGIMTYGYEDETEPLVDMLLQIKVLFEVYSKRVDFVFLDDEGNRV